MNRSILIVICDFLLVSLLAFSTVDINKVSDQPATPQFNLTIATNPPSSGRDLAAVMKLSLEEERQKRDLLMGELTKTRETAEQRQQALQSREQEATRLQQESARLQTEQARLQEAQSGLQQQYAAAQTNIATLNQQLQSNTAQATISNEKLLAMEAELQRQKEAAAALQKQLAQLTQSNQNALTEKQQLTHQLQVAEVEKRSAKEIAAMQEQVKAERAEKAQLAAGVQALATNSTQLAKEIRDYRPMAPNTIFNEYVSNRVTAAFAATRPGAVSGLFGGVSTKKRDAQTVLVTDGQNTYALSHIQDTPLELWTPGVEWNALTGKLHRDAAHVDIHSLSFHQADPRIVYVPVSDAEAAQLGGKIYRTSSDPYKFQDAVLIGTREDYYGECKFEIDTSTPGYVKLDRSVLRGLFGKFNPSRGDLVLSKQGELLGVMANSTYCLMLRAFEPAATFQFSPDVRDQHTGATLSALHNVVAQMPGKLQ